MEEKDFQEHFLRQRRNLMGFSIFVLAINISGAKLDKINLLGNELLIYRHSLLMVMLSIAILYFTVRYFQYFMHLKKPVFNYFSPFYRRFLSRYLISKQFRVSETFRHRYGSMKKINFSLASYYGDKVQVGVVSKQGGSVVNEDFADPSRLVKVRLYVLAALVASAKTPVFTEYILPVILAILGLVSFALRVPSPYVCLT